MLAPRGPGDDDMRAMTTGTRPKVFISHSTSGEAGAAALVARLRERLRDWGADPWLDVDRLDPGMRWNDEIRMAIERCDAAVLVVTERYVRSGAHYARDEALLFVQRAATEAYDDFRLLVLRDPKVSLERLANDPDWANLEITRLQVLTLGPDGVEVLAQPIKSLLERYCPGALPLVLREFYADTLAGPHLKAVLAQAYAALDTTPGPAPTARRFVNLLLGGIEQAARTRDMIERSLLPWRGVIDDAVREALGWDAAAFQWIDGNTARQVAEAVNAAARRLLVIAAEENDTVLLHLRRAREYVSPFDHTGPQPGHITREGLVRAISFEIKHRRVRRCRRDPLRVPAAEVDALAVELNERMGPANPLVVILGRDLCEADLLDGLPELFTNIILVALAGEEQIERLGPHCVVVRPHDEDEVLQWLDRLTA
jgi:hypothetical protein